MTKTDEIMALADEYADHYEFSEYEGEREVLRQAIEALAKDAAPAWMLIETAPKDGTYILLGSTDGSWVASFYPEYPSGYRPENPWQSMMLNHEHMGRFPVAKPTHWMPLPKPPAIEAVQAEQA